MSVLDRVADLFLPERTVGEQYLTFNGHQYPLNIQQTLVGNEERPDGSFPSTVAVAFASSPVVYACVSARVRLFSEARFQFRQLRHGRPGDLFGTPDLGPLENPWPTGTTGDLLARTELYGQLAGNSYAVRDGSRIRVLRPDWVSLIMGSPTDDDVKAWDVRAEVLGIMYQAGGPAQGADPEFWLVDDVAHYAPMPDPMSPFRGMSWLTPVAREVIAHKAATSHKLRYFENGATPNMIVKMDKEVTTEAFTTWVDKFKERNEGRDNAYRTWYLGGGADATAVGSDMKELDFKNVQGAAETLIAAAAGVPPIVVGLSEGLAAATYSNYGQARRAFADGTMRNLWRNAAGSFANIIRVPTASELWYDDRDISFLQEDQADAAAILKERMLTIESGVRAGYDPDSVVAAITSGDLHLLKHTGLYSVQLQPPLPDGVPKAITEE